MTFFTKPLTTLCAAALCWAGHAATADEIWDSATGLITYEVDEGTDAVFSFYSYNGAKVFLVLKGFALELDDRSTNHGFWVGGDGVDCGATLSHPSGYSGTKWGRAVVVWHKKTFPSGFDLTTGDCFGDPEVTLQATPTVRKIEN